MKTGGWALVAGLGIAVAFAGCRTPAQDAWLRAQEKEKREAKEKQAATAPAAVAATQPIFTPGPPDHVARQAEEYAAELRKAMERGPATNEAFPGTTANAQASAEPMAVAPRRPAPPPIEISIGAAPVTQTTQPAPVKPADPPPEAPAQPAPKQVAIATPDAPAPRPATPNPAAAVNDAPPAEVALEKQIARRVEGSPRDPAAHLDRELFDFVRDRQVPNVASLSPLPSEDRETLAAILDGLTNYRAVVRADPNATTARKTRPLMEMADRIRLQADLAIPTMQLCTRVSGFGNVDPVNPDRIPAGRDYTTLVYTEIANFRSSYEAAGMWETRLTTVVQLVRESDGKPVAGKGAETVIDRCRNRRHDFFTTTRMTIPGSVPAGRYVLRVTVTDQTANKVAESTMPVTLVAGAGPVVPPR